MSHTAHLDAPMFTLGALMDLLDATGAEYRLDRNNNLTEPYEFELRLHGKHWGFVRIAPEGVIRLVP